MVSHATMREWDRHARNRLVYHLCRTEGSLGRRPLWTCDGDDKRPFADNSPSTFSSLSSKSTPKSSYGYMTIPSLESRDTLL